MVLRTSSSPPPRLRGFFFGAPPFTLVLLVAVPAEVLASTMALDALVNKHLFSQMFALNSPLNSRDDNNNYCVVDIWQKYLRRVDDNHHTTMEIFFLYLLFMSIEKNTLNSKNSMVL